MYQVFILQNGIWQDFGVHEGPRSYLLYVYDGLRGQRNYGCIKVRAA